MTDKKLPQVGEWWRTREGEIAYVAFDESRLYRSSYPLVVYSRHCSDWYTLSGHVYENGDECPADLTEHLPHCTGFDWVESVYDPQTFTSDWGPHAPVWPSRKDPPEQSCSCHVRIVDGRVTPIGISEQQCGWWVEVKQ